jgi:putative ABC transport system permease protein
VVGILQSGAEQDERAILPLAIAQQLTGRPNQVDAVQVSALTKPEDDFARKNPGKMTPAELERWSCTNYVTSIAHQINEVLPMAVARPVRRIADSEGKVLGKVSGLMLLIALIALLSSALTVWSVTAATMLERRGEIAIMQATGASESTVSWLLWSEVAMQGLVGGLVGSFTGLFLARWVGRTVFHVPVAAPWLLLPLVMLAAIGVAVAGAIQPVRRTLHLDPAVVLREGV